MQKPDWLKEADYSADELHQFYAHQSTLWSEGFVTWGTVVQANNALFDLGPYDHPAELIFSADEARPCEPPDLQRTAAALFALKGHPRPPAGTQQISAHLTAEWTRLFGAEVPLGYTLGGPPLRLSTVMVMREFLPGKCLGKSWMPVVVAPGPVAYAAILPRWFWPQELVDMWQTLAMPTPGLGQFRRAGRL